MPETTEPAAVDYTDILTQINDTLTNINTIVTENNEPDYTDEPSAVSQAGFGITVVLLGLIIGVMIVNLIFRRF